MKDGFKLKIGSQSDLFSGNTVEMSYPFYYPYFSARSAAPPLSLHQFNLAAIRYSHLQEEQAEIELTVRLKEQEVNSERIRLYQEELRSKQKSYEQNTQEIIGSQRRNLNKKQMIEQRELILQKYDQHPNKNKEGSFSPDFKRNNIELALVNQSKAKEQALCSQTIQQYQQELLNKIQNTRQYKTLNQQKFTNNASAQRKQQENKQKIQLKTSTLEEENIIINKKPEQLNKKAFKNQKIIQQLKNPLLIQPEQQKKCRQGDHTLDVHHLKPRINQIFSKSHQKEKKEGYSVYQNEKKHKKSSRRSSVSVHNLSALKSAGRPLLQRQYKKVFLEPDNQSFTNDALKKINNRLKLSSIVFKDSQLSHRKYHIEHLINTYQMQERGRKQIKDKINNHPKIIKKHALVVSSR